MTNTRHRTQQQLYKLNSKQQNQINYYEKKKVRIIEAPLFSTMCCFLLMFFFFYYFSVHEIFFFGNLISGSSLDNFNYGLKLKDFLEKKNQRSEKEFLCVAAFFIIKLKFCFLEDSPFRSGSIFML